MTRRQTYSEEDLKKALACVRQKKFSVSKAAREHGVPRKTLSDNLKATGLVRIGRRLALSTDEEKAVADYLDYMSSNGFPFTR